MHAGPMKDEKQIRFYILQCFPKETQVTSRHDKAVATARYRAVVKARKEMK